MKNKEEIVSSTEATIQGAKSVIVVTNQNRMVIQTLDQQKPSIEMGLDFTPTLVRSNHEVPDNILMAFTNNNA